MWPKGRRVRDVTKRVEGGGRSQGVEGEGCGQGVYSVGRGQGGVG